jgi:hypothetical protein
MEAEIAIAATLRRYPELRLAAAPQDLSYQPNSIFVRGLTTLPVTVCSEAG